MLQFMAAKRIRMTHITSKEVAEGNLKSIMRVILALAAHYKPQSVREGSAANSATNTPQRKHEGHLEHQQTHATEQTYKEKQQYHEQKQYLHHQHNPSKATTQGTSS